MATVVTPTTGTSMHASRIDKLLGGIGPAAVSLGSVVSQVQHDEPVAHQIELVTWHGPKAPDVTRAGQQEVMGTWQGALSPADESWQSFTPEEFAGAFMAENEASCRASLGQAAVLDCGK